MVFYVQKITEIWTRYFKFSSYVFEKRKPFISTFDFGVLSFIQTDV